jgi:ribosome-binding factor A
MATSIRQRKIADTIKKELGRVINTEVRDPDRGFVTITHVRVTPDISIAYVYFSVIGEEGQEAKSLAVLEKASGFLRTATAKALKSKKTPELKFFLDDTLDYMNSMNQIVKKIHEDDDPDLAADADE